MNFLSTFSQKFETEIASSTLLYILRPNFQHEGVKDDLNSMSLHDCNSTVLDIGSDWKLYSPPDRTNDLFGNISILLFVSMAQAHFLLKIMQHLHKSKNISSSNCVIEQAQSIWYGL